MKPASYWRDNKDWSQWLGKAGQVIAVTTVRVARPEQQQAVPYSYVLVDFEDQRRSFMGVGHEKFNPGQKVVCVLRKIRTSQPDQLIAYGIKVAPIIQGKKKK